MGKVWHTRAIQYRMPKSGCALGEVNIFWQKHQTGIDLQMRRERELIRVSMLCVPARQPLRPCGKCQGAWSSISQSMNEFCKYRQNFTHFHLRWT